MKRLPVILSTAALAVAVLGVTPLGHAGRLISRIPPFAKSAHHADVAANALRLGGHKPSAAGGAGTIPVLDAKGKLPASTGAVGPQGPAGPGGSKGDKGDPGAPATALWALVKPDGSLGASQGVTASAKDTYNGGYEITFNKDVTSCAVLATAANYDRTTTAQVNALGKGGNTVRVVVLDTGRNYLYDTDFSIAAFC
ncbi:MAG TPA: hypothetical protein VH538_12215 [Gaiellaceae bacterium]|jgi:hypothetical protein